jgi:hypothetical protein
MYRFRRSERSQRMEMKHHPATHPQVNAKPCPFDRMATATAQSGNARQSVFHDCSLAFAPWPFRELRVPLWTRSSNGKFPPSEP